MSNQPKQVEQANVETRQVDTQQVETSQNKPADPALYERILDRVTLERSQPTDSPNQGLLGRLPWLQQLQTSGLIHPIAAFFITRLIIFAAAYIAEIALPGNVGEGYWHAAPQNILIDMWARWDSAFYISIINEGYQYSVTSRANVAFFPVYPLMVDLVNIIIQNTLISGILVSNACLLAALIYFYKLTEFEFGDRDTARRAVYYIASFPTAFYFSAIYTESTFLLMIVATMYYTRRHEWGMAVLFGILTAASRIIGVVAWGLVMLEWMHVQGWSIGTMYRPRAWVGLFRGLLKDWVTVLLIALIPLGLFSYMVFLYNEFRDPVAFMTVQAAWGRTNLASGLGFIRDINGLIGQNFWTGEIWWHVVVDSAAFFGAMATVYAIWRRLGEHYALYVLLSLLPPAGSGTQSLTRYVIVLFPIFMILAWWGREQTVDHLLTTTFTVFLGVFTAIFVNWVFLA
ncbi:MAG: mannosyltransferase family protein [Chloroflexota bacterium]